MGKSELAQPVVEVALRRGKFKLRSGQIHIGRPALHCRRPRGVRRAAFRRPRGVRRAAFAALLASVLASVDVVRATDVEAPLSCPSPAPLYELRNKKSAELARLLGLPPVPPIPPRADDEIMIISNRRWEVDLYRVWPPTLGHCHIAVVGAQMVEDYASEDGKGERAIETVLATFEQAADGRLVRGPNLGSHDWLARGQPETGDFTGDGRPDAIGIHDGTAIGFYGGLTGDACWCSIPGAQTIELAGVVVQVGGAILTDEQKRAAQSAIDAAPEFPTCPSYKPRYTRWDVRGRPFVRKSADALELHFVVNARQCSGWQEGGEQGDVSMCGKPRLLRVQQTLRDGKMQTATFPTQRTIIEVDEPKLKVLAVPWSLSDGDATVHRVEVTLGRGEGGLERKRATRRRPISLDPGVYLVQLGTGTSAVTYQVTVQPGHERIHVGSRTLDVGCPVLSQ